MARGSIRTPLAALAALAVIAGCRAAGSAADTEPADSQPSAEARAHAHMNVDPPAWDAARVAFRQAAEHGSATAMSHLGWIYEEGHGVAVDGNRAAHWYARAARAGALEFAVKLGWMYLAGDVVTGDRAQAEHWFRYAIDAGYVPARTAWASVLIGDAQGGGRAPERVREARELLVWALDEGHVLAAYFLARLYIEGIGGHPMDEVRAAHYTRVGAEHGDARMQGWLARMYLEGVGVDANTITAAKWANLAAAGGDPFGNQLRQVLEEALKPEHLLDARRQAVDWALTRQ